MRSIPRKMKKSFSPYLITEIARNLRGPPFSRFYHVFSQNIDDDYFFFSGKTIRSSALTWRSRTSLWKITGSTNAKLATE